MQEQLDRLQQSELETARSKATASLVLSLVALVFFGFTSLIAVPLGHSAYRTFNRYPEWAPAYGKGRATAGLTIGWIIIGCWALFWMVVGTLAAIGIGAS